MVVSPGAQTSLKAMSSKPMMEMSSGTRYLYFCSACMAPSAIMSLSAKKAVGISRPSSRMRPNASYAPVIETGISNWNESAIGSPCSSNALR